MSSQHLNQLLYVPEKEARIHSASTCQQVLGVCHLPNIMMGTEAQCRQNLFLSREVFQVFPSLAPCLSMGTLSFNLLVNTGDQSLGTHRTTFHVPQGCDHLTTRLGVGKQICPAACIKERNLLLFSIFFTGYKKKELCSLYFDILRRLTRVMLHQMS